MSLRFAVLGPGGVGGWIAAALERSNQPVTVVAREATAERIAADGIRVESVLHGEYVVRPAVVSRLEDPVDCLFVTTKAIGLEQALERIGKSVLEEGVVVPLLNGLEHMDVLRQRFGPRVAAGAIRVESDNPEPGVVVQTSPFGFVLMASDGDVERSKLEAIAAALEAADIGAAIGESEGEVLWVKLVRLNALAVTTSAIDRPIGFIRTDPEWRARLIACIEEACTVAAAEGVEIPPQRVLDELEATHDSLGSSMQRDINRGNPSELNDIPGAIVRAGLRHGIACPTIEELMGEIQRRIALIGG